MKSYFLSLIFLLLSNVYGLAQHHLVSLPESLQLPSKAEISKQLHECLASEKKYSKEKIVGSFKQGSRVELNDTMIDALIPMIFVRIYPDTLNNNILKTEVMDDEILLWHPEGYTFFWAYEENAKLNLNVTGSVDRTSKINDEINQLLPKKYILTFFPIKEVRWHYNYVGYAENGNIEIRDTHGNIFRNLDDLIIERYGSITDYVDFYKAEVHKKNIMTTIAGVKEFYRTTFKKEVPTNIEDAVKRKEFVIALMMDKHDENKKIIVYISDHRYDENGTLWYHYMVNDSTDTGWVLADKITPIK